ncbi:N-acetylglucosamine-6-phosphate deacetylase [Vibrio ishigakensis]|uniref:N-acetylglucosamine-6-phosphate deacetylase n=1 Tax=Vibrio ishigakensis TaxID=1481914 RepID=A0A0B8P2D0_9VIBR|nr:N-acetylglucosamine-6-phosphate deacetylase [Vibrio ishigakensis]GAM69001.1 N-acetylglucosamine-6-phosphate deacetylase [Vibrio sp. JCM 19236]
MYALTNCTLFTGSDTLYQHAVIIDGDTIVKVCPQAELDSSIKTIDLEGANVSPGFIDLQLNGCGGVMFNDEINADTLQTMQAANQKSGCTSYLPTLITSSDEDMRAAITAQREFEAQYANQSLGLHLEAHT